MNFLYQKRFALRSLTVLVLLTLVLPLGEVSAKVKNNKPLVWDMESLQLMKDDISGSEEAQIIIKAADRYCEREPAVVNYQNTITPNKHYYFSSSPYRWPDPSGSGKYIWKDGEVNPDSRKYGSAKMTDMAVRCRDLSKAYYLTGDKKYYLAIVKQLKAWFIEDETRMLPTFEYAQVIPGEEGNKGNSAGMIEAYTFNTVIESIRLTNHVKKINRSTMRALQRWFLDFADDSEKRYGKIFSRANNNISLAFDVTMTNMYLFAGKEKRAKEIADGFVERRINKQILEDGSQPEELTRTNAFSYSIYNLMHIVDFCYLIRNWDDSFYKRNGERIELAFNYLAQYVAKTDLFPHKQISGWETCTNDYYTQLRRVEKLRDNN